MIRALAVALAALLAFTSQVDAQAAGGSLIFNGAGGGNGQPATLVSSGFGGRLTTASGVCVQSTDVAAATALYYAPCGGNSAPVYNGTTFSQVVFTSSGTDTVGLTLNLGASWTANTLYDVFIENNSGVGLCTGPAWTSSVAGSSSRAASTSILNGIPVNAASMTCRTTNSATITCAINQCSYLGTILINAAGGQIDLKFGTIAAGGGMATQGLCNAYNKINGRFAVYDSTASWSVTALSTYQPLDGSGTNRINFVSCFGGDNITAQIASAVSSVNGNGAFITLGYDSTTAAWTGCQNGFGNGVVYLNAIANCSGVALVGLSYIQGLQWASSASITYTSNSGSPPTEGIFTTFWF
jgi:hypothetical protein